jgi:3'-phosphoadenosine 5'-phosphosulfate sulfotransferase (PAPS reductase)/FAD synthetase
VKEPVLRPDDLRAWDAWRSAARLHARSPAHRRVVDQARRVAAAALEQSDRACCGVSGGKDSAVLGDLIRGLGAREVVMQSEKDDLDYPGEEAYVAALGARWGGPLEVVRPPVSPLGWLLEHAGAMHADSDVHSRAAELAKACFYRVMEAATAPYDTLFLGLRAAESGHRKKSRWSKGLLYTTVQRPWQRRCTPLGDWKGIDVYAYAEAHDLELFDVYRCVAFAHRLEPWTIRKSWWLPGSHSRNGQAAWLRRYYPSLFELFRRIFPDARAYT